MPKLNDWFVGVVLPEVGCDFLPKKSGTEPLVDCDAGSVDGWDDGLPNPATEIFCDSPAPTPANRDRAGVLIGVVEAFTASGNIPPVGGSDAWAEGSEGGDSGAATIEPEASGDDARGRDELIRERGPEAIRGMPRLSGLAGGGPSRPSRLELDASGGVRVGVGAGCGGGLDAFMLEKEIPENELKGIFGASSSSIGGRSSSRAENRPEPFGEVALELFRLADAA